MKKKILIGLGILFSVTLIATAVLGGFYYKNLAKSKVQKTAQQMAQAGNDIGGVGPTVLTPYIEAQRYAGCQLDGGCDFGTSTHRIRDINFLGVLNGGVSSSMSVATLTASNLIVTVINSSSKFSYVPVNTTSHAARVFIQGAGTENPFQIVSSSGMNMLSLDTTGAVTITGTVRVNSAVTLGGDGSNQGALQLLPANTNFNFFTWRNAEAGGLEGVILGKGAYPTQTDILTVKASAASTLSGAAAGLLVTDGSSNGTTYSRNALSSQFVGQNFVIGGSGSINFQTYVGGFANRAILTNAGNFGLGTSTPLAFLSVLATSTNGSNPIFEVASSSNASLLRILANGNIGINSSSPNFKLAIEGSSYHSQTSTFAGNVYNLIDSNTQIARVASTAVGSSPRGIFISGKYAYVTNGTGNTLSIVDITNPLAPFQISTAAVGAGPRGVYVVGRYAYVTNFTDGTMSVVDVSNPAVPVQVSLVTVGTSPRGIHVSGGYAYVANLGGTFSVVDISNPLAPKQIVSLSLGSAPYAVYVQGRYAYVANNTANTMNVVDITDPSAPFLVTSTPVGTAPVAIFVSGKFAYLTNNTSNTLSIVNIANPTAPVQVTTTAINAGSTGVYVAGRYAYVSANSVNVLDISSSTNPILLRTLSGGSGPLSIYVAGHYAYVPDQNDSTMSVYDISGAEFTSIIAHSAEMGSLQVTNDIFAQGMIVARTGLNVGPGGISSEGPLAITGNVIIGTSTTFVGNLSNTITTSTRMSVVTSTAVGSGPRWITISGKYAYVTNGTAGTMSIMDISNPLFPSQISTVTVGAAPRNVYVSGRYAYVANSTPGTVSIIDISNPFAPVQVSTVSVGAGPRGAFVSGKYLYTTDLTSNTLSVTDISNPLAPTFVATTSVGAGPVGLYIQGRYAYVANNTTPGSMSIVDISNPAAPVQISTTSLITTPSQVYVSGRYAYVTSQDATGHLIVVDVSNPSIPVIVASTTAGLAPSGLVVNGRYAYIANQNGQNISVIDISSSTNPIVASTISTGAGNGPIALAISGRYAYMLAITTGKMFVIDISGTEVSSLTAGNIEAGNIQVRNDIFAQGNIMAGTGLMVGAGGIISNGSLSVFASSTGATTSIFDLSSAGKSNALRVLANGNVGIGTSSPVSALAMSGSGEVIFTLINTTSGGVGHFGFHSGSSGSLDIGTRNLMDLSFETNDITRMRIASSSGFVGINTNTPVSLFAVDGGTSTFNGKIVTINGGYNNNPYGFINDSQSGMHLNSVGQLALDGGFAELLLESGVFKPGTGNQIDLGADGFGWKDLFVSGTVKLTGIGTLITGNGVCYSESGTLHDAGAAACVPSSIRYKENIHPFNGSALEEIAKLNVVLGNYKKGMGGTHVDDSRLDQKDRFFLIAEEVAKVDPRLVDFNKNDQPETLNFDEFNALYARAFQEIIDMKDTKPTRDARGEWLWRGLSGLSLLAALIAISKRK